MPFHPWIANDETAITAMMVMMSLFLLRVEDVFLDMTDEMGDT